MGQGAREAFTAAAETHEQIVAVEARLDASRLAAPSVLPGWSVADLLAHCHQAADFRVAGAAAYALTGTRASTAPRRLRAAGLAAEAVDPHAEVVVYGPRPMPFETFVDIVRFELPAHHRDLLWSLGSPVPLPRSAAEGVLRVFGAHLARIGAAQPSPAHPVSYELRSEDSGFRARACFDGRTWSAHGQASRHAAIRGADHALAALLLGRIDPDDRWLHVRGDRASAGTFSRWFPGPR